jgi:hypothetical protein
MATSSPCPVGSVAFFKSRCFRWVSRFPLFLICGLLLSLGVLGESLDPPCLSSGLLLSLGVLVECALWWHWVVASLLWMYFCSGYRVNDLLVRFIGTCSVFGHENTEEWCFRGGGGWNSCVMLRIMNCSLSSASLYPHCVYILYVRFYKISCRLCL